MADNVIPFPVRNKRLDPTPADVGEAENDSLPVTREEMIQLVLRYAYGAQWAQDPAAVYRCEED